MGECLGAGVNGEVHAFTSPLFPGAVLKNGRQGWLSEEANFMARMRHPHIVRVLAKVIPHGGAVDPNQPGFIAMERLGASLVKYDMDRSALGLPKSVSHTSCV